MNPRKRFICKGAEIIDRSYGAFVIVAEKIERQACKKVSPISSVKRSNVKVNTVCVEIR